MSHCWNPSYSGREKGAFTGADRRREGRFVEADGGTLFLDEIGDISPVMRRPRLLRAIQEREVQRVGSNQTLAAGTMCGLSPPPIATLRKR